MTENSKSNLVCHTCGALVAQDYLKEHTNQHGGFTFYRRDE